MSQSRIECSWLPVADDWNARLRTVEQTEDPAEAWTALQRLATTRMSFVREERLDAVLTRRFGSAPPPGLATAPIRLALLGSSTTHHLATGIRVAGLRRGLWIRVWEPDYGQYRQALAQGGALRDFAPTAMLFALDGQHLFGGEHVPPADEVLAMLRSLWRDARSAADCQLIQQTILPSLPPILGSNDHRSPQSAAAQVDRLNAGLRAAADEDGVDLLALDSWTARLGIDAWHDPRLWHRAKQELSPAAAPLFGELAARLLAAAQGRSYKCLVLDLDNTLWGGVVGDDGLAGITIGQGSALGEAFAAFQSYLVQLCRRGVILAVCSKNDEANALAPFDHHPEMLLRREHIAAFAANWNDKASNLRVIAARLNIGLDAMVFVDDNPFERELVRRELPMVAVPELSDDPSSYARLISDAGYFEALSVTREDEERTRLYAENRQRAALQADATDLDAYLRSLDMRLRWSRFDALGLKRIVQLINKTNQFNLTTRRYGEADVEAIMADPDAFGLQFRLLDSFGDNGIIAIVIGRVTDRDTIEIDSWLMSCRVLGRHVEDAMLHVVMAQARSRGASRLIGRYVETGRNAMVADLYPRLGFVAVDEAGASTNAVYVRLAAEQACDLPMTIEVC